MNNLFNTPHAKSRGRVVDPTFKYISATVINNMRLVKKRVYSSARYVSPNHLLYRILIGLSVNKGMSFSEMYNSVTDLMYEVGNSCSLTSALSVGKVHKNVFMDGCSEVIFIHNDDFTMRPWYELEPVKFHYHCETNLNCVRGGNKNKEGIAIISINMPMLAWMYAQWAIIARKLGSSETTYNFIAKYVLTGMLPSYTNISYFNQVYYSALGVEFKQQFKHPEMALADASNAVDKNIAFTLQQLTKGYGSIDSVLYGTQLPFAESALELYNGPKVPLTRQITWIIDIYRLPLIHYGLVMSNRSGHNKDSGKLTTFERDLGQTLNTRVLERLHSQFSTYILEHFLRPVYDEVRIALGKA